MTPDEYQQLALLTWYKLDDGVPYDDQANQAMLQLASEAGELAGEWAKHLYKPGRILTPEKVLDELGDIWYYVRIIAYLYGWTIDDVTDYNRRKLMGGHGWNGSAEKIHDNQHP